MQKIRCLLVDDHILVRQGIRQLLDREPDMEVVEEASSAQEAVTKASFLQPDVVLMDVAMPGLSSFEAVRQIRKASPSSKILFLTMYDDEEYVLECMEAGAAGYVLKDAPIQELINAARNVYRGGKHLSPRLLSKMIDVFQAQRSETSNHLRVSRLTPREGQILKLLAEGKSARQIAMSLELSVRTVESHRFNLMHKLNVHNRAELVAYAVRKKIIKIPTHTEQVS